MQGEWAQEATDYQEDQTKKRLAVGTGDVVISSANNIRRSSIAGRAGVVLDMMVHIHLYIIDLAIAKLIVVRPSTNYVSSPVGCIFAIVNSMNGKTIGN